MPGSEAFGTAGTEVAVVLKIGGAAYDKVIGHYLNIKTLSISWSHLPFLSLNPINEMNPLGLKVIVVASDPIEAKVWSICTIKYNKERTRNNKTVRRFERCI
ncbi:hypothetical protein MXS87_23190 [Escherichia coli]|nr:hypothetical protein [Escherichia coli]